MTEVEKYKRQWARQRWWKRTEGVFTLSAAGALSVVLVKALDSAMSLVDSTHPGFWASVLIVAIPGAGLFWIGIRRLREKVPPPQVREPATELSEASQALNQALWEAGAWPESLSGLPLLRIDELNRAGDWKALLEETTQLQATHGPHPWVQWLGTAALQKLKRHREAADQFEELLRLKLEHPEARLLLACDLARQRVLDGRSDQDEPFFDLLVSSGVSDGLKAWCLDCLATIAVYEARPAQQGMFLSWAQEALRLCPDRLTLKGTLGSVLCENDRWDEAEPLLREVLDKSPALQDQGISAAYLARLCHRRGDLPAAKDWLAYSRYVYPSPELDARLRRELPELYEKTAGGSLRRPAT